MQYLPYYGEDVLAHPDHQIPNIMAASMVGLRLSMGFIFHPLKHILPKVSNVIAVFFAHLGQLALLFIEYFCGKAVPSKSV